MDNVLISSRFVHIIVDIVVTADIYIFYTTAVSVKASEDGNNMPGGNNFDDDGDSFVMKVV